MTAVRQRSIENELADGKANGFNIHPELFATIYLVRHGETVWNKKDILQGQLDSALTTLGKRQAEMLAKEFKGVDFSAVFSSDLSRARRTAEITAMERKLAVKTSQLLRERNWGRFDGKQASIYRNQAKEMLQKYEKLSEEEQWRFKAFPDIESNEEVFARFMAFLREVAVAYRGKTILVVSHLDVLRTLLIHLGCHPRDIDNMACIKLLSDGVNIVLDKTRGITM